MKSRYNNHKVSFKHCKHSHDTVLSNSIKWSILNRSTPYKRGSIRCNLYALPKNYPSWPPRNLRCLTKGLNWLQNGARKQVPRSQSQATKLPKVFHRNHNPFRFTLMIASCVKLWVIDFIFLTCIYALHLYWALFLPSESCIFYFTYIYVYIYIIYIF